jgi:acetyltransferase-like isoleucine patch superfamily enzyme
MTTPAEIRVPRETVNDDTVRVVRWLVADGAEVRQGMPVVELETSKSVIDVESGAAGRIRIVQAAGAQVPVGEVLGIVGAEAAGTPPPAVTATPRQAAPSAPSPTLPPTTVAAPAGVAAAGPSSFSAKARALLAEHGIDEAVFAHLPLVREADVRAHLGRLEAGAAAAPAGTGPVAPLPASGPVAGPVAPPVAMPAAVPTPAAVPWKPKGLLGDAARSSADRNVSLVALVWNYFWRNWLLGNLVRLAPRGVINVLHRWRGVRMGADCFIDPAAILETAYPENITLGDDVRVTAGAIIMTHIKPPHYLRDAGHVPVVLKPVVLEDHCFIGVNAVVMPGVTVGRAAVVASGAVVTTNVPALTMVAGNPAKIVKRFTDAPAAGGPPHHG